MNQQQFPLWFRVDVCDRLESNDETLVHLNLNLRRLDMPMAVELSRALSYSSHVQSVNLTGTFAMCPAATQHIFFQAVHVPTLDGDNQAESQLPESSTTSKKSLRILHLSYNTLRDKDLFGSLVNPDVSLPPTPPKTLFGSGVTELFLDFNRITSAGAILLAQNLHPTNMQPTLASTLRILKLNNNKIGDEGMQALARALEFNTVLEKLDISYNPFGEPGATALVNSMMHSNRTLLDCRALGAAADTVVQCHLIPVCCKANRAGRGLLNTRMATKSDNLGGESHPLVFLPHVLFRSNTDCALKFFLLRQTVDLWA